MKLISFFFEKSLLFKKPKFFYKIYFENCAFYGLGTEPEHNRNLSKVETGTVKNSYGFAALEKTVFWILNDPDPTVLQSFRI